MPSAFRMARTSEVNSWPPGMPMKAMPVVAPSASDMGDVEIYRKGSGDYVEEAAEA